MTITRRTITLDGRYFAAALGIILILLASIAAHVVTTGPLSVLQRAIQDALHAPGFAAIAFVTFLICRSLTGTRTAIRLTLIIALGIALLAEGAQVFVSRDADLADIVQDLVGIVFGTLSATLVLSLLGKIRISRTLQLPVGIAAAIAAVFTFAPLIDAYYAIHAQKSSLPVLADFESRWEKKLYPGSLSRDLKLVPSPVDWFWPGGRTAIMDVSVHEKHGLELFPYSDWTEYSYLSFEAASAIDRPTTLFLRVHDAVHNNEYWDRYAYRFQVSATPQTFRIRLAEIASAPRGRSMDLSQIEALVFFTSQPAGDEKVLIDNIRLE